MTEDDSPQNWSRPDWDQEAAEAMIGAVVLIGVTRIDPAGETQEQMYGIIQNVDAADGFEIILSGEREGETYWLPPSLDAFEPARPGEYRLRSTGEIVVDPDYISQWSIQAPPN